MTPEAVIRLALTTTSGPVLDLLLGKPDPPVENVPATSPAPESYPPDYHHPR